MDTTWIAAGLALLCMAAPAAAQQSAAEREQLCVNQCLFHYGPASNPHYHDCVARMCVADSPAPAAPAAPAPRWTNHATANGGGQSAAIEAGGRSFNYICQRGGPALIGLAGFGGDTNVTLRIGGQPFRQNFVARGGVLYTDASPALTAALAGGNLVEVTAGGQRGSFTLSGSGAAIRKARAACGLRP